jgi:hypothetical protein
MSKNNRNKEISPEILSNIFTILANPAVAVAVSRIINEKIINLSKNNNDSENLKENGLKVKRVINKKKTKDKLYISYRYYIDIPSDIMEKLGLKEGDSVTILKKRFMA